MTPCISHDCPCLIAHAMRKSVQVRAASVCKLASEYATIAGRQPGATGLLVTDPGNCHYTASAVFTEGLHLPQHMASDPADTVSPVRQLRELGSAGACMNVTPLTEVWQVQTTASECTLVALLAGRARQMEGRPLSDTSRLVAYFSDQVHPNPLVPLWLEHQGCMQAQYQLCYNQSLEQL